MNFINKESGFTLLESLFQLLIAAAFLHLIILFLLFKESTHQQLTDSQAIEWELFMVDIQKDLSSTHSIYINDKGTILNALSVDGKSDIEYSAVGGVVRKRVGNQGHVPLLTKIQRVEFIDEGPLVAVSVTLLDGSERLRRVAIGFAE
ncbi:competence type IV pilus minor pilin ComGF [Sporosarcina sp. A2]|uniref:competence type IV pilus minor pilin ComGF n=1 Tax=Sporosarcina sp. A2 TaxID=3393449 RepID=UPI003D795F57